MLELFENTWEDVWAGREVGESYGAVFTRTEIVDLILDLAGYRTETGRLAARPVLEPSCGRGAFVLPILDRLIESEHAARGNLIDWSDPVLDAAMRAVDIDEDAVAYLRQRVAALLGAAGCPQSRADALASRWIVRSDFLLHDWTERFDYVIGNPPYVRIESLPRPVLQRYRSLYPTLGDRADLYVAFIERGLQLLSGDGVLGLITANRFAKNLYGRRLRRLIAERYRVCCFLNLEHTQPFESEVSAYPAITVVDRRRGEPTRAGELRTLEPAELAAARTATLAQAPPSAPVQEFRDWYRDGSPWTTTCRAEHRRLERLRGSMVSLESSARGTRVGIGVATGADRVFILPAQDPAIEPGRQIPLALTADLSNRGVEWSGHVLLNPFADSGGLVDLEDYPGLRAYLTAHRDRLVRRHVARTRPERWYRTIDRIWPELQRRPKLLIPDIQPPNCALVAHDEGCFYPHHNLYWITSEGWDLRALRCLLRSSPVMDQIRAYSVQMRGGSVRWQAQTLRMVMVPPIDSLSDRVLAQLSNAADSDDPREIDDAAANAFGS